MAKRTATSELTDRNWDQEEEKEEAGEFVKASQDALKGRQIIKAKRRTAGDGPASNSAFSGFGGFSFKPTQTSTPLFSGGFSKTEPKISNDGKRKEDITDNTDEGQSPSKRKSPDSNGASDANSTNGCSPDRTKYLSNLKALNLSVMNWISQHLDKNPYCILTPIFTDYETHLSKIEAEKDKSESNGQSGGEMKKEDSVKPMEEDKPYAPKSGLTFGMGNLGTKSDSTVGSGFMANLETKSDSKASSGFKGFSFQPTPSTDNEAKPKTGFGTGVGFGFATGATGTSGSGGSGFSFAVGSSTASGSGATESGDVKDDEYVPPVVETVQHEEEGSIYSSKCKLFYQKDGSWAERGVGYVHLKKTDDVPQLLVRADTTLGNILLNIRLSSSIPVSRQGKNNLSMMCVVNPPIPKMPDDKPIPLLFRVKTGQVADELLAKIKEITS